MVLVKKLNGNQNKGSSVSSLRSQWMKIKEQMQFSNSMSDLIPLDIFLHRVPTPHGKSWNFFAKIFSTRSPGN